MFDAWNIVHVDGDGDLVLCISHMEKLGYLALKPGLLFCLLVFFLWCCLAFYPCTLALLANRPEVHH